MDVILSSIKTSGSPIVECSIVSVQLLAPEVPTFMRNFFNAVYTPIVSDTNVIRSQSFTVAAELFFAPTYTD